MKILVAYRGIPQSPGWATGDFITDSFKRLGHEVYTYGNYYQEPGHLLPDHINKGKLFDEEFDLVLCMDVNDDDPLYTNLRYVKARHFAYWNFDISYNPPYTYSFINFMQFNHLFCANDLYTRGLEKNTPTTFLPYAFSIDKHRSKEWPKKDIDFSIVGSPWGDRERISNLLKEQGVRVEFINGLFREEYINALARSHATINYNVEKGRGLLVMRIFEAMGAETCLITNDGDFVDQVAIDGLHCLVYRNQNELIDICKRHSMAELDEIGQNGYLNGVTNHTYDCRAQEILRVLELK
jgi:spore maturation protein CgeB